MLKHYLYFVKVGTGYCGCDSTDVVTATLVNGKDDSEYLDELSSTMMYENAVSYGEDGSYLCDDCGSEGTDETCQDCGGDCEWGESDRLEATWARYNLEEHDGECSYTLPDHAMSDDHGWFVPEFEGETQVVLEHLIKKLATAKQELKCERTLRRNLASKVKRIQEIVK